MRTACDFCVNLYQIVWSPKRFGISVLSKKFCCFSKIPSVAAKKHQFLVNCGSTAVSFAVWHHPTTQTHQTDDGSVWQFVGSVGRASRMRVRVRAPSRTRARVRAFLIKKFVLSFFWKKKERTKERKGAQSLAPFGG